jgi:hypothetical protein
MTNYLFGSDIWKDFFCKKVYRDDEGNAFEGGVGKYAVYRAGRLVTYADTFTEAEKAYLTSK